MDRLFEIDHRVIQGSIRIPTHSINELLATKLRAFCQRDKGRDLFDLWWSNKNATIDPGEIVSLFHGYMGRGGSEVDSAPELRVKVLAKQSRGIFEEVRPLLRSGVDYQVADALEWFEAEFIGRLRNDDGTRVFAQG